MRWRMGWAAGAATWVLAGAAGAQPAAAEPTWSTAPEVVVTAGGPRLWKLERGGGTVWVLGYVEPMAKGQAWSTARVEGVIARCDRVLLAPTGSVGLLQALGALRRSHLPRGRTLDGQLTPELKSAYAAALARLGRDPAAYQHEKPVWAALVLQLDISGAKGLSYAEPEAAVRRLARSHHVPDSRMGAYRAGSVLQELLALPDAQGRAALADSVRGADFALDHAAAAGRAWAAGRLAAVRENLSPDETPGTVFRYSATYRALDALAVDDTVAALDAALARSRPTFALLSLSTLARRGGALDRLRAQGVAVTEPPG